MTAATTLETAIFIEDLCLNARVGILEHERLQPQRLLISLHADIKLDSWPISDLSQSLSYADVAQSITDVVMRQHWDLLEDLAQAIQTTLSQYDKISHAKLTLRKPDILENCHALGFSLRWSQG